VGSRLGVDTFVCTACYLGFGACDIVYRRLVRFALSLDFFLVIII
jgi:hypothetical protein